MEVNYINLSDSEKKDVELILSQRMRNENVPFQQHEDISFLLINLNPLILLKDGIVVGFSETSRRIIKTIVDDRKERL